MMGVVLLKTIFLFCPLLYIFFILSKVEINGRQARVGRSVRKAKPGQPVGGKPKNKGKKIGQVKKTSQENPARNRIKNKTLGKNIKNGQPSKTEERSFQGTITDKSGRKIKPKIGKMEKKKKALAISWLTSISE